jgi:hypothetical protein
MKGRDFLCALFSFRPVNRARAIERISEVHVALYSKTARYRFCGIARLNFQKTSNVYEPMPSQSCPEIANAPPYTGPALWDYHRLLGSNPLCRKVGIPDKCRSSIRDGDLSPN